MISGSGVLMLLFFACGCFSQIDDKQDYDIEDAIEDMYYLVGLCALIAFSIWLFFACMVCGGTFLHLVEYSISVFSWIGKIRIRKENKGSWSKLGWILNLFESESEPETSKEYKNSLPYRLVIGLSLLDCKNHGMRFLFAWHASTGIFSFMLILENWFSISTDDETICLLVGSFEETLIIFQLLFPLACFYFDHIFHFFSKISCCSLLTPFQEDEIILKIISIFSEVLTYIVFFLITSIFVVLVSTTGVIHKTGNRWCWVVGLRNQILFFYFWMVLVGFLLFCGCSFRIVYSSTGCRSRSSDICRKKKKRRRKKQQQQQQLHPRDFYPAIYCFLYWFFYTIPLYHRIIEGVFSNRQHLILGISQDLCMSIYAGINVSISTILILVDIFYSQKQQSQPTGIFRIEEINVFKDKDQSSTKNKKEKKIIFEEDDDSEEVLLFKEEEDNNKNMEIEIEIEEEEEDKSLSISQKLSFLKDYQKLN